MQQIRMISGLSSDLAAPAELDAAGRAWRIAWGIAATGSMAASAFHGYRRNESVGWAIWWAFCGGLFPILTPTIAVAQGFGKRKK